MNGHRPTPRGIGFTSINKVGDGFQLCFKLEKQRKRDTRTGIRMWGGQDYTRQNEDEDEDGGDNEDKEIRQDETKTARQEKKKNKTLYAPMWHSNLQGKQRNFQRHRLRLPAKDS
jgi:hypothetical protein